MRTFIPVLILALGACGQANVYDRPMPTGSDPQELNEIRDALKPEDRDAWAKIIMRKVSPLSEGVTSKTVGEAIARMNAQTSCMEAHSVADLGPDIGRDKYNAEAIAYNECLKLPV